MPKFEYRGVTAQGVPQTGQVEAPDEQAATAGLRAQGVTTVEIVPIKEPIRIEDVWARKRKVPNSEIVVFTRQLATLVDSGVSVLNSLVILEEQVANLRLRETLQRVIDSVEAGESMSEAMERERATFSELYVAMVRAGESSGSLHETLLELAGQLEREEKNRRQAKAATRYPMIVSIVAGLVAVLLLTFVVPQFENLFASLGGDLPGPTQFLIQLSEAIVPPDDKLIPVMPVLFVLTAVLAALAGIGVYRLLELGSSAALATAGTLLAFGWTALFLLQFEPGLILVSGPLLAIPGWSDLAVFAYDFDFPSAFIPAYGMVAVVVRLVMLVGLFWLLRQGFHLLKSTPEGRRAWDRFKLNAPMRIGPVVQKLVAARFTRSLSTLTRAGVPVLTAFEIVKGTANNVLVEEAAEKARREVSRGASIAAPLAEANVFPPLVPHMINVGERTGSLDAMLLKVAQYYEDEVDLAMKSLTSIIEPIMIVIVGVVIGGMVICLYLPLFKIFDLLSASAGSIFMDPGFLRHWTVSQVGELAGVLWRR